MQRFAPGAYDPEQDTWEVYYLPDDFTQAKDLAAQHPEKLAELKELFWQEAERNRVLPLLGGMSIFFGILPPMPTTTRFTFHGDVQNVQRGMIPRIYGRSYAIEADLNVPDRGAEGVLVANADFIGGFALWVDDQGHLRHSYSMLGVEGYKQVSDAPIPTGDVTIRMQFDADEAKPGTGGRVSLYANDTQIGEGRIERTVPIAFSSYAGMDVGRDNGLVVDRAYRDKAPYAFTGTVNQVVFDLQPQPHEAEKAMHQHTANHAVAAGVAG
jgi:arylsulfatase